MDDNSTITAILQVHIVMECRHSQTHVNINLRGGNISSSEVFFGSPPNTNNGLSAWKNKIIIIKTHQSIVIVTLHWAAISALNGITRQIKE